MLSRRHRIAFACVVIIPLLAYFGLFLAVYGNQFLQRRDESNIFMILHLIRSGAAPEQVFLGTWQRGFVLFGLVLSHISLEHLAVIGRVSAFISGGMVILFTSLIAQHLAKSYSAFIMTAALIMSSELFVGESTYFRANLPSLSIGSLVFYLLLRCNSIESLVPIILLGVMYGLSFQIKMLSLTMLPAYCIVMVHGGIWPTLKRICSFALGLVAGVLVLSFPNVGSESPIRMQLPLILGTPVPVRMLKLAGLAWYFFRQNSLVVYSWICGMGCLFIFNKQNALYERRFLTLAIWTLATLAVLCLNYPTWDHHFVFLVPPLAATAGWCFALLTEQKDMWRYPTAYVTLLIILVLLSSYPLISLSRPVLFEEAGMMTPENALAVRLLRERLISGSLIWSDDHVVTLSGHFTTSPELSEMSWKRNASGLLTEEQLRVLLIRDRPSAIVISYGLFDSYPGFVGCLEASLNKMALNNEKRIYWSDGGIDRVINCLNNVLQGK